MNECMSAWRPVNEISCHRLGYCSSDYNVKHSCCGQFSHHSFLLFPPVFSWGQAPHFWSWACFGLELMGLGISTNSIYAHLNWSSFVAFQAETSAGGGLKCFSCQCTNSLICFASGLSLLFDYLTKAHLCSLGLHQRHFILSLTLSTIWSLSDLGKFRTYVCVYYYYYYYKR